MPTPGADPDPVPVLFPLSHTAGPRESCHRTSHMMWKQPWPLGTWWVTLASQKLRTQFQPEVVRAISRQHKAGQGFQTGLTQLCDKSNVSPSGKAPLLVAESETSWGKVGSGFGNGIQARFLLQEPGLFSGQLASLELINEGAGGVGMAPCPRL